MILAYITRQAFASSLSKEVIMILIIITSLVIMLFGYLVIIFGLSSQREGINIVQ